VLVEQLGVSAASSTPGSPRCWRRTAGPGAGAIALHSDAAGDDARFLAHRVPRSGARAGRRVRGGDAPRNPCSRAPPPAPRHRGRRPAGRPDAPRGSVARGAPRATRRDRPRSPGSAGAGGPGRRAGRQLTTVSGGRCGGRRP
jgi:hypothetical protein